MTRLTLCLRLCLVPCLLTGCTFDRAGNAGYCESSEQCAEGSICADNFCLPDPDAGQGPSCPDAQICEDEDAGH